MVWKHEALCQNPRQPLIFAAIIEMTLLIFLQSTIKASHPQTRLSPSQRQLPLTLLDPFPGWSQQPGYHNQARVLESPWLQKSGDVLLVKHTHTHFGHRVCFSARWANGVTEIITLAQ